MQAQFLNVRKLVGLVSIPEFDDEISFSDLENLLDWAVEQCDGSKYREWFSRLQDHQQREVRLLLRAIDHLGPKSVEKHSCELLRANLADAVRDTRCFPDHHQQLLDVCLFSSVEAQSLGSWERCLVSECWKYLAQQMVSSICSELSRTLFGNSVDSMETHTNACICKALDLLYGLFGGRRVDDEHCPCTPVVTETVRHVSLQFLTLSAVFEATGKAICSGVERWEIARELLGSEDAEAGNCENDFCRITGTAVELTFDGFKKLCGARSLRLASTEVAAHSRDLSREECAVHQSILHLVRAPKRSLSWSEWKRARELQRSSPAYNSFFRLEVPISAVLLCHITRMDDDPAQDRDASQNVLDALEALPIDEDLGPFLYQLMCVHPNAFHTLLHEDARLAMSTVFRARPLWHACAHSGANSEPLVRLMVQQPALRKALLMDTTQEGWTVYHMLAEHHGEKMLQVLETMPLAGKVTMLQCTNKEHDTPVWELFVGADKKPAPLLQLLLAEPDLARRFLKMSNGGGWTVYHCLAEHHGQKLLELLQADGRTRYQMKILTSINFKNLIPVWEMYACRNKKPGPLIQLMLSKPDVRRSFTAELKQFGWTLFHMLAEHHGQTLREMLEALPSIEEQIEILTIPNAESHVPVWEMFAGEHKKPDPLVHMMMANPALRRALKGTPSVIGWNVYHMLADYHGGILLELLELFTSIEDQMEILTSLRPQTKTPVWEMLALTCRAPSSLVRLMVAKPQVRSMLLASPSIKGFTIFHVLAEHHADIVRQLLEALPSTAEVLEILCATDTKRGGRKITVGQLLEDESPSSLRRLLAARTDVARALAEPSSAWRPMMGTSTWL